MGFDKLHLTSMHARMSWLDVAVERHVRGSPARLGKKGWLWAWGLSFSHLTLNSVFSLVVSSCTCTA
jgi:hypothetical protein